jgi:integrase
MSRRGDSAVGRCRLVISEPKTTHSRREVPLHATTVSTLRKHRIAQMEERMAAANFWIDEGLVFTTETGGKVEPRNFLRVIEKAAATAKVEGVGVHTLRHSAATMWLESGIHIKQVADLLGHYSTSITGDIYGHGSDDGARRAIEKLGEQLGL